MNNRTTEKVQKMKSTFPLFDRNTSWPRWVPMVHSSCPLVRRRCRAPRAATHSPRGALRCPLPAAGRSTGCPEVRGGGGLARRASEPADDRREHQDELLSWVYVNINDSYSLRTCISVYVCVSRSAVSDFLRPASRTAGRFFTI